MTSGAVPDAGAPAAPVPPGVDGPAAPPDAPAPEPGEFDGPKPTPAADQATVAAPDGDAPGPLDAEVLDVLAGPAGASVPTSPRAETEEDPVLAGLAAFGAEHGAAGGRPVPLDFGLVDDLPWADPEPQATVPAPAPERTGDEPDREPEPQAAPAPEPQAAGDESAPEPEPQAAGDEPESRAADAEPQAGEPGPEPELRTAEPEPAGDEPEPEAQAVEADREPEPEADEAGVTVLAFPVPQVKVAPAPDDPPRLVPSLLPAVEVTVERTVARWLGLSARPSRLDWPRLLVGAMQHRVEGLCVDALRALAWDELAPPSVVDTLERRALLAESRFLAHYHALQELRDLDEELVASLVLLNGAALVGDYTSSTHRMVGDVDVYVDAEHAVRLGERARRLGYWEKDGESGPTYYKDVATGVPGAGYVGIDVHLAAPADGIGDGLAAGHWGDNLVPHVVGDVKVHRPTPALELTHLLVRLHEHAGSWARWVAEDDVRLVRILDVELVAAALDGAAAAGEAGAEAVLGHAEELGVISEVAVGAAVVQGVRGALPAPLAALEPYAEATEECTHLLALPAGAGLLRVDEPLIERALCVDKSARTRALAAGDGDAVDWSRGWRRPTPRDADGLAAIADRAADLLTESGLVQA